MCNPCFERHRIPTYQVILPTNSSATAVIIGCLPAFAIVYRKARSSRRGGYGSGYTAMPSSYLNPQGIPLSNTSISASKSRLAYSRNSTTPSLAKPGAIEVTQSVRVAHENHDMI